MRRVLLATVSVFVLWVAASPAAGEHTLPNGCALSPIPTTYEGPKNRSLYLRGEELAGFNMIAPGDSYFRTPVVEKGSRSNRSAGNEAYVPPRLLKAIGHIESNTAQADHSVYWGATGPTKISFDCGYGIMQITSGMTSPAEGSSPSTEQSLVATHYLFNIARGAAILVDKWNSAPQVRPIVGNGNPRIVEDWYFAVWSYNGFASVNNPLNYGPRSGFSCGAANDGYGHDRRNYPYQELVFGCATRPPWVDGQRLWSPLAVTLPNLDNPLWRDPLSRFPNSSQMDMPTPGPSHQDSTSRPANNVPNQLLGSPSLAVGRTPVIQVVNRVTITNTGSGILAWRAKPEQSWLRVNKKAGVVLGSNVSCTSGNPCARSVTLTITVNTALAPATGQGRVIIESLTTGERRSVWVLRGRKDHFYATAESELANVTAGRYAWEGVSAYIAPGPRSGWVPLYRLWKAGGTGDHFYTTSASDRDRAVNQYGYTYEKVAGYVSPTPAAGLVPLYRLWKGGSTGDHFYTTSASERDRAVSQHGYQSEGVAGYVAAQPSSGLVPFFRWWNGATRDHFYTTEAAEPSPSARDLYRFEGVTTYVAPGPRPGWVPLYRLWKRGTTWDHFYTTSASERDRAVNLSGYTYERVAGYVSATSGAGLVPLYRLWKGGSTGDHFYTTSASERNRAVSQHGYEYEGVEGYVSASGAPGLVPLFRWWLP